MKYKRWTLVDWHGNKSLNYKCWVKSFGRGKVYVGCGEFELIVYSYGHDSEDSCSSTRFRKGVMMSEEEAMRLVDSQNGKHP